MSFLWAFGSLLVTMQNLFQKILFLLAGVFLPSGVFASVVINEIAWMGTEASYNDEWIELYNNSDSAINLAGWQLEAADGTPAIQLSGTVPAHDFYLMERTDDNTVPGVAADLIYKGSMGNNGENLRLYDVSGGVKDSVDALSGWFSGDNALKQTMERKRVDADGSEAENWQTSLDAGGTPKAQNSSGVQQQPAQTDSRASTTPINPVNDQTPPTPFQTALEKREEANSVNIYFPDGIVLNEILPSPEGSDAEEEWVEFFNQNDFSSDLSGWQMTDTTGSVKTYLFPAGTLISAKGFLTLTRPISGITLNNGGDGLQLKKPNGALADQVSFSSAPRGQSYNRGTNDWEWSDTPTPGSENVFVAPQNQTTMQSLTETNSYKTRERDSSDKNNLANASLIWKASTGKIFILAIAIVLAISSGLFMLFLKRRLGK